MAKIKYTNQKAAQRATKFQDETAPYRERKTPVRRKPVGKK